MDETHTIPNYPWYQIGKIEDFYQRKESESEITEIPRILQQGFLVFDCPVFDVSNYYGEFDNLKDGEETDIEPDIKRINLIIVTQSCDLANDRTEQVLLCGFFSASNPDYQKNLQNIKTSKMPAFCMIEASEGVDIHLPSFERQVIDFRAVYTLPKKYVLEFIGNKTIVRLLPPYREFVAQAFARFFMRVGLPKDLQ